MTYLDNAKEFCNDSKKFVENYLSLQDKLTVENKVLTDDLVSYERLKESFKELDLSNLYNALEIRKNKLSENMTEMASNEPILHEKLKVCKDAMKLLFDIHSDLSKAIGLHINNDDDDKFVVEMSKLLYGNLIDNHQLRADPPICGVYKNRNNCMIDNWDTTPITGITSSNILNSNIEQV